MDAVGDVFLAAEPFQTLGQLQMLNVVDRVGPKIIVKALGILGSKDGKKKKQIGFGTVFIHERKLPFQHP